MSTITTVTDSVTNEKWKISVEKYVREKLFPLAKFTTDHNTRYKTGSIYRCVVRDLMANDDTGEETWKKIESVIRRSFNNKRNNTVETMKIAFKSESSNDECCCERIL